MPIASRSRDTAGAPNPEGLITGAVLRAIRHHLGLSQDQAAELLGVDPNTVKSWETGRRPLSRIPVNRLRTITRILSRAGAPAPTIGLLDDAIDVDLALGDIHTGDPASPDHPLAVWVHNRAWHDMLSWAIAGKVPRVLRDNSGQPPRLAPAQRQRLFDQLRSTAEANDRVGDAHDVLLRRQIYYIAAWDDTDGGREWLADRERRELRRIRPVDGWAPDWVAGRSLAVARATQGDGDHLRHFIETQLTSDRHEVANLRYWAYWIGEESSPAISDEFMAASDLGLWRGTKLLRHLTASINTKTPYIALNAHTAWALLQRRPWLLDDDPALTIALRTNVEQVLDRPGLLTVQARRELEQIRYATNMRRMHDQ